MHVKKVRRTTWKAVGCRRDGRRRSPRITTRSNSSANSLLAHKNSLLAGYAKRLIGCNKHLISKSLSAMSPVDFELGLYFLREFSLRAGNFRAGRGILDSPVAAPIVPRSRTGGPVRRA